jgi:hypothetical protein
MNIGEFSRVGNGYNMVVGLASSDVCRNLQWALMVPITIILVLQGHSKLQSTKGSQGLNATLYHKFDFFSYDFSSMNSRHEHQ